MNAYCNDCHIDTAPLGKINEREWYMVHDWIWEIVNFISPAQFLCIGCLEKRLNRELMSSDFTSYPINNPEKKCSPRLKNRLKRL